MKAGGRSLGRRLYREPRRRFAAALLATAVLAGAGCAEPATGGDQRRAVSVGPRGDGGTARDGGTGSGAGFVPRPSSGSSGAAASGKGLGDLDAMGVTALCEELEARFSARITDEQAARFVCALTGLRAGLEVDDDGEASFEPAPCETSTQNCLLAPFGEVEAVNCEALATAVRGCELEREPLQSCYDAQIARIAAEIEPVSCAIATVGDVDALFMSLVAAVLPECKTVADECPRLLPRIGLGAEPPPAIDGCSDTCESALDGRCDDGGDGSDEDTCVLGSDCTDCGPR